MSYHSTVHRCLLLVLTHRYDGLCFEEGSGGNEGLVVDGKERKGSGTRRRGCGRTGGILAKAKGGLGSSGAWSSIRGLIDRMIGLYILF